MILSPGMTFPCFILMGEVGEFALIDH